MTTRTDLLQDEISGVIVKLMQLRENDIALSFGGKFQKIFSLSSNGIELSRDESVKNIQIDLSTSQELKEICRKAGYTSPVYLSRCTVSINGKNFFIRSMHKKDRPLINHSSRDKYLSVCDKLGISIAPFDKAVDEYWRKRTLGVINEDVQNISEYSPFNDLKDYLNPILTYMFFTSSAKNNVDGIYDADYVLDYENCADITTWHIYDKNNYIDSIWPYLRFSFRADRGMPKAYQPNDSKFAGIHPWVHFWQEQYKGALHIRIVSFNSSNPRAPKLLTKYKEEIKAVKSNKGERDELIIKFFFLEARMKGLYLPINEQITKIEKVGSSPTNEYKDLPFNANWSELSAPEIISLANICNISKAGKFDKADIFINDIGISVKSQRGAAPTLINQTVRASILRVMNHLNQSIIPLDNMVNRYWALRLDGTISEDTKVTDKNFPFVEEDDLSSGYNYLHPLLTYFAFEGTGTRDSEKPAELILEFQDPLNQSSWIFYTKDTYIRAVWNRLKFSIRGKGLTESNKIDAKNTPWIRCIDGKEKGTLNVRVEK